MSTTGSQPIRALWAQRLVREKLAAEITLLQDSGSRFMGSTPVSYDQLPTDENYKGGKLVKEIVGDSRDGQPHRKVCIVGAGVAGLYIAMILDDLKIPNLSYDIVEASDRIGGRVYTHRFSDDLPDYYDIGAMRYPHIKSMDRTFRLFKRTEMPLIPYYLKGPNTPGLFNDRFFAEGRDPYHVGVENGGSVPDNVVNDIDGIFKKAFGPYKEALKADFDKGFEKLMTVDDFSTREFLKRGGPDGDEESKYNFFAIQWMETQGTSTNLFDQAFSESVIDSFDFDDTVEWSCIEGGTSLLTDAMQKGLSTAVETGKRVEAISVDHKIKGEGNLAVKCANEEEWRTGYSTVFSTTTLGCLGRMDLRGLDLHPSQKDAIRSLHYDDSVKVALKFKYPWWIKDCGITQGGVASTDLPLRTCVYPSYNLKTPLDEPAVLLASYTWAQDATRMGSLVNRKSPDDEAELVDLILQDLGRLHGQHITYERIKDALITHHAYSWSHDPTTAGAFALFGPGQFSNLYPYLSRPAADSKFHIVGEASSAHHAWIVGALDSAYAAVYRFLYRFGLWFAIDDLVQNWGELAELEAGEHGTVHLQVALGKLPKKLQFKV
ncbi:hypothetical protein TWF506_005371 [Arthrobotrys conoides]|uniref:Amine oxidase domain-containing protein n=1 Tax=Arthrobotrys conoides TaxID=74498 RepID=A0AAN8NW92_9PEZI